MALGDACAPRVPPTPGCTYVARERLQLGGDVIEPGQPFPHLEHGMTDLQAELWWSAAILDVAPAAEPDPVPPPDPKPAKPKPRK